MRYICLVHVDGELAGAATKQQFEEIDRKSLAYNEYLESREKLVLGSPLGSPESATIVRSRKGQVSMLNGPYSETKEHLGGLLIIEARDLNEAVEIAAKVPMAEMGSIEVRALTPIPPVQ